MENTHRAKSEAQATQEAQAFLQVTQELCAKYPELGEDGIAADKVLALSDIYRGNGYNAVQAIQQAVADLYPEPAAPEMTAPAPAALPEEPAPAEPAAAPEPAVAEEPAPEPMIPDMSERTANKRKLVSMPTASARNEPAPEPEKPTRTSAIKAMKERRNQV